MKKRLIWGWVILVFLILCRSRWLSLSGIYIYTILMVLTHPWGYRWSSSLSVLILYTETTSCKMFLYGILWGDTRSLSDALHGRIRGSQSQHASCIQIGNCTPSWSTSDICSIFHGCLIVTFMLMRKLVVSKVVMCIRWEYTTITRGAAFSRMLSATEDILMFFFEEWRCAKGINTDGTLTFSWLCIIFISNTFQ